MASHTVQFTNHYAALPSDAAANHPHIIDLTTYTPPDGDQQTNMKLPDAVVTMLHQISVNTLDRFLDPHEPSLRVIQSFRAPHSTDKLVIAKRNKKVLVGIVTEHIKEDCFEFDNLVRFDIAQDGSWDIAYMSYRDYFRRNWDDVWAGRMVDLGYGMVHFSATPGYDPTNCWDLLPFQLANNIMTNQLWDAQMSQITVV